MLGNGEQRLCPGGREPSGVWEGGRNYIMTDFICQIRNVCFNLKAIGIKDFSAGKCILKH